jgi:tetratricopeptide (TPR) repeat protein
MGTLKRYDELGVCCVNVIGKEHTMGQKMTKARLLLEMGKLDDLFSWLDALSSEGISNWETHYLRARVLVAREEPLKALAELEQFTGAPISSSILRAEVLAGLGKEAEALAALVVPNPDAAVLKARGEVQLKFKRFKEASESFSKSLEMDPRCISAWYGKGMAHLGNSEPDEAIGCFDTAIGLDDNYVWAWAGKVRAYRAKGDAKNAARSEAMLHRLDSELIID